MQLEPRQEIILSQCEERVTFECQMEPKMMQILALWLLMGLFTTLWGLAILIRLVHLSHDDLRVAGIMPIFFGCLVFGASWLVARLASTVTFDLKQKLITITPKWQMGRKQIYRFDEIQSLHVAKRSVGALPFILRRWRFFFILRHRRKISFGETYDTLGRDEYLLSCTDKISSLTSITSQIEYNLKHVLFFERKTSTSAYPPAREAELHNLNDLSTS
jgi:hypothetical protein